MLPLRLLNQARLHRVMRDYIRYYNTARPHQGIQPRIPDSPDQVTGDGPIRQREVLRQHHPRLLPRGRLA